MSRQRRDHALRGAAAEAVAMSRNERGSIAIETLMMATSAVALVIVAVAAGRYVDGSAQANDAAYAAARAASLEPTEAGGIAAGQQAAEQSLTERGKSCRNLVVSFAGSSFVPGGQVITKVSCTVALVDAGALGHRLGLKPYTTFTEQAVVPIEVYRNGVSRQ